MLNGNEQLLFFIGNRLLEQGKPLSCADKNWQLNFTINVRNLHMDLYFPTVKLILISSVLIDYWILYGGYIGNEQLLVFIRNRLLERGRTLCCADMNWQLKFTINIRNLRMNLYFRAEYGEVAEYGNRYKLNLGLNSAEAKKPALLTGNGFQTWR